MISYVRLYCDNYAPLAKLPVSIFVSIEGNKKNYAMIFFFIEKGANEQVVHLVVSDRRRPWAPRTEELQVSCRPLIS